MISMRKYRNEIKFVINKDSAEILKKKLSLLMNIDSNSITEDNSYLIRSLYFDDLNSNSQTASY